jgi:hypothetical protein
MHPEKIKALEKTTPGERAVFRFLRVEGHAQSHSFGAGPSF